MATALKVAVWRPCNHKGTGGCYKLHDVTRGVTYHIESTLKRQVPILGNRRTKVIPLRALWCLGEVVIAAAAPAVPLRESIRIRIRIRTRPEIQSMSTRHERIMGPRRCIRPVTTVTLKLWRYCWTRPETKLMSSRRRLMVDTRR